MKDNNILSWVTSGITLVTASAAQDLTQLILLIIGVLSSAVSLAYTLWKWYRKAKADGKITEEEVDEAAEIIKKHTEGDDNETK